MEKVLKNWKCKRLYLNNVKLSRIYISEIRTFDAKIQTCQCQLPLRYTAMVLRRFQQPMAVDQDACTTRKHSSRMRTASLHPPYALQYPPLLEGEVLKRTSVNRPSVMTTRCHQWGGGYPT